MTEDHSTAAPCPDEARARYHHGDLLNALLDAAEELIVEHGPEAVTLSAVARRVGVSPAACYRHVSDKQDLYGHLAARGFDALAEATSAAVSRHAAGSIDALISCGQAYVAFVTTRPALFEVMWGTLRERFADGPADQAAACSYTVFTDTLHAVMRAEGLSHLDPKPFGAALWSMVHGAANLTLGKTRYFDRSREAIDAMIDAATRRYIEGARLRDRG